MKIYHYYYYPFYISLFPVLVFTVWTENSKKYNHFEYQGKPEVVLFQVAQYQEDLSDLGKLIVKESISPAKLLRQICKIFCNFGP